jgi:hypothetical protein
MKISWHFAAWIVLASFAQCPIALAHWPGYERRYAIGLEVMKRRGGLRWG